MGVTCTTYGWSLSAKSSFTPITDTVCGASQFISVKCRLAGVATPSLGRLLVTSSNTSALGLELSTTVNVAEARSSLVTSPSVGVRRRPGESSSMLVTSAFGGSNVA